MCVGVFACVCLSRRSGAEVWGRTGTSQKFGVWHPACNHPWKWTHQGTECVKSQDVNLSQADYVNTASKLRFQELRHHWLWNTASVTIILIRSQVQGKCETYQERKSRNKTGQWPWVLLRSVQILSEGKKLLLIHFTVALMGWRHSSEG